MRYRQFSFWPEELTRAGVCLETNRKRQRTQEEPRENANSLTSMATRRLQAFSFREDVTRGDIRNDFIFGAADNRANDAHRAAALHISRHSLE